jgi:hypothetical protein
MLFLSSLLCKSNEWNYNFNFKESCVWNTGVSQLQFQRIPCVDLHLSVLRTLLCSDSS